VGAALTRWGVAGLVVWLVLLASAAGATSKPDYQGTGVIVGLHPAPSSHHETRPVVVLHHDPIAGLMDETMSMPFIAASAALFKGLKAGDRVRFDLKVTPDALLVISIQRMGSATRR
jgi:Cu/Ag efflux protein CusF